MNGPNPPLFALLEKQVKFDPKRLKNRLSVRYSLHFCFDQGPPLSRPGLKGTAASSGLPVWTFLRMGAEGRARSSSPYFLHLRPMHLLDRGVYGQYDSGHGYTSVAAGTHVWIHCHTQEVSRVLVDWAPVYRHLWHRLVHIHMYRLMQSTTLQGANKKGYSPLRDHVF